MTRLFFGLALLIGSALKAQDSIPLYQRYPTIPPFKLLQVDSSTTFSKDSLKKNEAVLIMYFSPDCDHCQHQTEDLLKQIDSFKNVQIVMVTYQPFESIRTFYQKYNIPNYPNIHLGRDTNYFIVPFYRIHFLPYLALYDKQGNLITTFEGTQKVSKILRAFAGQI